ncbi:glycine cleavage T C-terminal barrel domain-containing protein [Gemmatimonas aurantiaca]|uniref:CAF17-like 4Fe-4S cluster assembly/insertion protein YgfZ n=1 Tax=Gemmatimonas aurantiaca TaxID=173480 RepID=UPI00301C4263
MPALIVAFDGVLADTLGARAEAILTVCSEESVSLSAERLRSRLRATLPGRTIAEAVELLLEADGDPTRSELVSLRAQRHYTTRLAQGVPFDATVLRTLMTRAGAGDRIVVRADSTRREVEPQLTLAGIEHHITLLRCADDRPSRWPLDDRDVNGASGGISNGSSSGSSSGSSDDTSLDDVSVDGIPATTAYPTLVRSWRAIDLRLRAMHVPRAQRTSLESSTPTAVIAAAFVNMSTSNEPAAGPASSPPAHSTTMLQPLSPDDLRAYETAHDVISDVASKAGHDTSSRGVIWFASGGRWSRIQGEKATDALNGLVTNDVSLLAPGAGLYAAALTPKGKMVSDLAILREDDRTLHMFVEERALSELLGMMRKYINPRLARTIDESTLWCTWALYGRHVLHSIDALGVTERHGSLQHVWSLATGRLGEAPVRIVRAPALGELSGLLLSVPAEHASGAYARLEAVLGAPASTAVAEVLRIEGGRPLIGVDMDGNTIPQEANLDALDAISFTKGCYTGQETVARIHFRGHVNRHLRALRSTDVMPAGAQLVDTTGKVVGDVRSSAISPRLGPIAIGMVRREIQSGDTVFLRVAGEENAETAGDASQAGMGQVGAPVQVNVLPTLPAPK